MFEVGEEIICISVTEVGGYDNEYITNGNHYTCRWFEYDAGSNIEFIWITTDDGDTLKYPVYLFKRLCEYRKDTIDYILDI